MFNKKLILESNADFTYTLLTMIYVTFVILSIVLFDQILKISAFGFNMQLSGAIIPYVFLYPISFIVLRIYGLKRVNHMIGAMVLVSLVFVIFAKFVVYFSYNETGIHEIISNSFKMYLAGFIGMPAGIYASFVCLKWLMSQGLNFNFISLTISTVIGEIINTLIVFPIGFYGHYDIYTIIKIIFVGAMVFKIFMGAILAVLTVAIIDYLAKTKSEITL